MATPTVDAASHPIRIDRRFVSVVFMILAKFLSGLLVEIRKR
jgi:hypothetical protein